MSHLFHIRRMQQRMGIPLIFLCLDGTLSIDAFLSIGVGNEGEGDHQSSLQKLQKRLQFS